MADTPSAIDALERVLITVEAELTALHTGTDIDRVELEHRLRTELTSFVPDPEVSQYLEAPSPPLAAPSLAATTQPPPPLATAAPVWPAVPSLPTPPGPERVAYLPPPAPILSLIHI